MNKGLFQTFITLIFIFAATLSALAQSDVSTATVKGTVSDQQGAAVPNATITVKDIGQGTTRTTQTGPDGQFQVRLLRPGLHEVLVEAPGFTQYLLKAVELTVGQTATFDIKLRVATVKEEVVVTAAAPLIAIEQTQQANTINNIQIENLPNVGRGFTSYVYTLPGVSSSNAPRVQAGGRFTFGSSGFSIGGSNGRNNLVTLDGGENEYGSGQLRTNISPEAIQEFQVNRSAFTAEFGFTAGTAVNVVSKSGTNNFRGSAYAYYRSQKTSARDVFDFSSRKSFDQQIYPGFTLGGPIARNKLFFFTNYEHLKSDSARFRSYTDSPLLQPSAAQTAFLNNLANANPTNANLQRIIANLRAALTTTASNYPNTFKLLRDNEGSFNAPDRLNNWTTRIDYQISSRDSISGRFSLTRNITSGIGTGNGTAPNRATDLIYRDYTTVTSWTHTFGPNVVNQARVQFSPNNSALTVPKDPESPSLIIPGFASFGRIFSAPFNTIQDRYQFEENLTLTYSRHTFKFGGSYRPVSYNVRNDLWFSGDWTFQSSAIFPITLAVPAADRPAFLAAAGTPPASTILTPLQNFNLNQPFQYRRGFNNPIWKDTAHYLGLFAQDSWKVHPRLTLDYGGRIDYDGEPAPIPHNTYFSPRFGFAWDIWGDHKTVLRGGGGLFYSPIYYQVAYVTNLLDDSGRFINQILKTPLDAAAGQSPEILWKYGVGLGKLPFKALNEDDLKARNVPTGRGAPNRVLFQIDPNYENNYSVQASLGIQRQIISDLGIEVAYLMTRGVHIQMPRQINYRESANPPATRHPALGPLYERIDPTIAQLNNYQSTGNSIYHGMTVSLTKRYSHNYQFQINYTFSKAIDDQTDFNSAFSPAFPTRLFLERGLSSFDIRHNLVASGVFGSPFKAGAGQHFLSRVFADITISPVIFIRSGIPFTLYTGGDTNGDTHGNDRLIHIGRNTGIGPNYRSVDLRFTKAFRFKSESAKRLEFITEATNLFNRTNFAAVNDIIGQDPNAPDYNTGTVRLRGREDRNRTQPLGFTAAFTARQVQFGLKFAF